MGRHSPNTFRNSQDPSSTSKNVSPFTQFILGQRSFSIWKPQSACRLPNQLATSASRLQYTLSERGKLAHPLRLYSDDAHSAVLRGAATVVTHAPPPVNIASKRVWRRLLGVRPVVLIATTGAEVPLVPAARRCPQEHSRPDLLRNLRLRVPPH